LQVATQRGGAASGGTMSNPWLTERPSTASRRSTARIASWAVWSEPDGRPKSNMGDLNVLDPDRNPALLGMLRSDVVMVGLNLSRDRPAPFGNFHDAKAEGQD
jgi:hypothetical protein